MTDPISTVQARAALEDGARGDGARPIKIGRFAPYPAWLGVALLVRGAQLLFFAFSLWYLAALFDAMDRSSTTSLPPLWLWGATVVIGAGDGRSHRIRRTSPMGDAIGNFLASQDCPACGQNVFDHTPPTGYAPPSQQQAFFPSRLCTNCGHDLAKRTV